MASTPSLSPRTLPILLAAYWHKRRDEPFEQHLLMWPLFWTALVGVVCLAATSMGLAHLVHGPASGSEKAATLIGALGIFSLGLCAALFMSLLLMGAEALVSNRAPTGFGLAHLRLLWWLSAISALHHGAFLVSLAITHDPVLSLSYAGQTLTWASLCVVALLMAGFVVLAVFMEVHNDFVQRRTIPPGRAHKVGADLRFARMHAHKKAAFRRQTLLSLPLPLAGTVLFVLSFSLPQPGEGAALVVGGVLLAHAGLALLLPRPRWLAARRALWAWSAPLWIGACFTAPWIASHDLPTALHAVTAWAIAAPICLLLAWCAHKSLAMVRRARQRFVDAAIEGMSAHQRLSLHRERA